MDNSSAFRMDPTVPLVVPEVNPQDAALHTGIVANPNCSTIITVTAIAALNRLSPIRSMVASTYQAVSGAGVAGIGELHDQISALEAGRTPTVSAFPHQIAYNLIPQIGGTQYEGYTSEEMKMQNEGRRLLHLPDLTVSCTCVRVPVIRSHSISATLRFDRPICVEEAREAIAAAPGCRLMDRADEGILSHASGSFRPGPGFCGTHSPGPYRPQGPVPLVLRGSNPQGAATNAVQIAELLFPAG